MNAAHTLEAYPEIVPVDYLSLRRNEKDYFCLDPESVESKITDKTKAIIAVDLFGQPFSRDLVHLADINGLYFRANRRCREERVS